MNPLHTYRRYRARRALERLALGLLVSGHRPEMAAKAARIAAELRRHERRPGKAVGPTSSPFGRTPQASRRLAASSLLLWTSSPPKHRPSCSPCAWRSPGRIPTACTATTPVTTDPATRCGEVRPAPAPRPSPTSSEPRTKQPPTSGPASRPSAWRRNRPHRPSDTPSTPPKSRQPPSWPSSWQSGTRRSGPRSEQRLGRAAGAEGNAETTLEFIGERRTCRDTELAEWKAWTAERGQETTGLRKVDSLIAEHRRQRQPNLEQQRGLNRGAGRDVGIDLGL